MLLYGALLYGLVATGRFPDSKVSWWLRNSNALGTKHRNILLWLTWFITVWGYVSASVGLSVGLLGTLWMRCEVTRTNIFISVRFRGEICLPLL